MSQSIKPDKPHKDYPLFAHANGQWAKKVRQKLHYFGQWADPDGALEKWADQKDDILAGRTPRVQGDGLTVRDLANKFLESKRHLADTRELSLRTWADYHASCARIIAVFGSTRLVSDLAADDFERLRADLAKTRGPVSLGNEIQRVRTLFKYADDSGLIERPVRYGPQFKRPHKAVMRRARQARGLRMFEAVELRKILDKAGQPLKAMILLGINCGFGNSDVGTIPLKALDLKAGWVTYPRPKTAIERRAWLWPETVKAIQEAIAKRPTPKDDVDVGLAFVTKYGLSFSKSTSDNPVSKEMAKLLIELKLHRPGLNFYALRHTFETIAGESRDQVAVDAIMGHAREDMASVYRERISDERIKAVCETVRAWLFPKKKAVRKPKAQKAS